MTTTIKRSYITMEVIDGDKGEIELFIPMKRARFDYKAFNIDDFGDLKSIPIRQNSEINIVVNPNPIKIKRMPVIIFTDIGADIDDTLALFVLLGSLDAVEIIAVVTSINNGLHRGAAVRGFLRLLGIADKKIEILPTVDGSFGECFGAESFPTPEEANLGKVSETPKRIIELCKKHEETGVYLYGIGSLTPLAAAINKDKNEDGNMHKAVKGVYLQGNCQISNGESKTNDPTKFQNQFTTITPDPIAYNFNIDLVAATTVFEYFQDSVPFTILGKFTAYQIPLLKSDFVEWTKTLYKTWKETFVKRTDAHEIPNPPSLFLTAKRQLKRFRSKVPDLFDSIFNVPSNLTEAEKQTFSWFDSVPDSFVCAHPYDPLLGLKMVEDIRKSRSKEANDLYSQNMDLSRSLFKEYQILNKNGHKHVIIGNLTARHSVVDCEFVHDTMASHVAEGLKYHGDSLWFQK